MNNPAQPQPHSVLVVEDSPTQAAQLRFLLESEGYEVRQAANGAAALRQLANQLPSLIISDVIMPEMDGYALCQTIKSNPALRQVPVILLTALSEPMDIFKGLQCNADHYTIKPYDDQALLSRIKAILADRYVKNSNKVQMGLEITYAGQKYFINADRIQILDLLLATFENVVRKNRELEELNRQLKESLETNRILSGLLPICAHCKNIRNDEGYWERVDRYIATHTQASFTLGICPDCIREHYSDLAPDKES